ncbi:hypothetical protein [Psychrobacter sp. I-STPA6b]|uniref:hypothetical protein n=1 Tax=Psychrobacter sp. I-STPA6b TaxID=2585718 RepID=UPI001D0C76C1|nr:hypothetical protein [Psychrobacter sp. I-STPA6b]
MILNKADATNRLANLKDNFLQNYSGWSLTNTPSLYVKLPKLTDFVYLKRFYKETNLVVFFNIAYTRGEYGVSVGWSDSLPLRDPEMNEFNFCGYWLDYYRENQPTEEFQRNYMMVSLERLHGRLTRNRYLANKVMPENEFSIIFEDLETVAVEYWKIMLKRRFNIEAEDLRL